MEPGPIETDSTEETGSSWGIAPWPHNSEEIFKIIFPQSLWEPPVFGVEKEKIFPHFDSSFIKTTPGIIRIGTLQKMPSVST